MKKLIAVVVIMTSTMMSLSLMAQYVPKQAKVQAVPRSKDQLFKELPESFQIDKEVLEKLFALKPGDPVRLPVTSTQFVEGVVIEKATKNPQVVTMNIRATNFAGALLSLSRKANGYQPVNFIGRMINVKYGDAFVLKKRDDQFVFVKSAQSKLLPD